MIYGRVLKVPHQESANFLSKFRIFSRLHSRWTHKSHGCKLTRDSFFCFCLWSPGWSGLFPSLDQIKPSGHHHPLNIKPTFPLWLPGTFTQPFYISSDITHGHHQAPSSLFKHAKRPLISWDIFCAWNFSDCATSDPTNSNKRVKYPNIFLLRVETEAQLPDEFFMVEILYYHHRCSNSLLLLIIHHSTNTHIRKKLKLLS